MFSIDATTHRSPNYDARHTPIQWIVVHSCEGRPFGNEQSSSIPWLCTPKSRVSAHYYVTRESTIYQLVAEQYRAWHAGLCSIAPDANSVSIGIELEHAQNSPPYPDVQCAALAWLCRDLMARYAITPLHIVSHRAVALKLNGRLGRKVDPTDWDEFAFRLWVQQLKETA